MADADDPFEDLDSADRLFRIGPSDCRSAKLIRNGLARTKEMRLRAQSRPSWKRSLSLRKPRPVTLPTKPPTT